MDIKELARKLYNNSHNKDSTEINKLLFLKQQITEIEFRILKNSYFGIKQVQINNDISNKDDLKEHFISRGFAWEENIGDESFYVCGWADLC